MLERLLHRWNRPQSTVTGWLRARKNIAIIRANSMCFKGIRRKWHSTLIGFENGAGI